MALARAEGQPAFDVGVALDADEVGGVVVRGGPLRRDIPRHPDDVVDDDRLPAVDDPARDRADRTDGSRRDGAERDLDVVIGELAVEPTADLVELDTESARR